MVLLYSFEGISSKRNSGDSCEDTPVPMPNTEVKLTNAESTWLEAAREDRKLLIKEKDLQRCESFLHTQTWVIGHFVLILIPMKIDII